jgi:hypothetical protein
MCYPYKGELINNKINITYKREKMAHCKYCGESAGLFKNEHEACKEKFQKGKEKITSSVHDSVFTKTDLGILDKDIKKIAKDSFVSGGKIRSCIIKGWETAVEEELNKGLITETHEALSDNFIKFFEIEPEELNQNGWMMKAVKSLIIHNLRKGKIVKKAGFTQVPHDLLPEGEQVMWVFDDVNYFLGVMHNSISLDGKNYLVKNPPKSMKDYKKFPGNTIKSKESLLMDIGSLMITNKSIYFAGKKNKFGISLQNIISATKYDDGIEIQKGNMINSPMFFETGDGWFTYELIKGLRDLAFSAGNS